MSLAGISFFIFFHMQALLAYIQRVSPSMICRKTVSLLLLLDGKIVYTNPAIRELFGYEEDEVKGVNCANLRHDKTFALPTCWKNYLNRENIIRVIQCFGKIIAHSM